MKRTRARWLVLGWSVFVLLWVFVLAIVGEYLARGWLAAQWSRAEAISALRAEQNRASMRAAFAGAAPEAATSDVNPFEVMSEAERVAWVVDRNEAAFVCDAAGKVLRAYVPGPVTPVHRLAAQMVSGQDLGQQLAERYVDQALAAPARSLHQPIADRLPVRIHWPQPIRYSGDAWDLFQFQSYPTLEKDSEGAAIVHLKQSVWETWAVAYRRNAVIPDSFEWSGEDLPTLSFSTNNLGFRGGSVAVPKPAGVYRIVCVGGSTTVEGPTGETTYPAILERRLREMIGTPNIEVVNAGVHGANSATVLSRAQDYLALEPDLVVEYNFINDYARYASSLQGASIGAAGWNPAMRLRAWLRHSSLAYMAWPALLNPGDAELGTYFETAIYDNLRALRGALARGGAEVCFASFAYPDPGGLSPPSRTRRKMESSRMVAPLLRGAGAGALGNPLLHALARPPHSADAQANRRGEAPLGDGGINAGARQPRHTNDIGQSADRGGCSAGGVRNRRRHRLVLCSSRNYRNVLQRTRYTKKVD